ncbi:MAG: ferritin family protein [Candidatus Krumholzibacteria bacterium]|nr:ferritin family protein [Candidatus Krumholzibacteria bacterium]
MAILQPSDIVDIGIEKEKKRRDFYAIAAERFSDDPELAALFGRLRDWEEGHVRRFEKIRETVAGGDYAESYPGEIGEYMKAVVDDDLYRNLTPESFAASVRTPAEALDKGIGFEKDAILFFGALARFLDEKSGKVGDELIAEEQMHMVQLFAMKKKLV